MKPHRVFSLVAALGLFAMLMPATMGLVLAWSAPSIASVCSNDQTVHNWTVTLTGPSSDFGTNDIQWADNAGFSGATDVTMAAGANPLSTPASVTTLYVRWASDHTSQNSATWSGGACSTPTVPPTQAPTDPPTLPPTNPPPVPPPEAPPGTPVAPPTQCVVGVADAAAVATDTSCPTPFDSFQGETATPGTTPPPTSTGGTDSGNNATPLFALLICLAFGGLGLAAVEMQRRSISR